MKTIIVTYCEFYAGMYPWHG